MADVEPPVGWGAVGLGVALGVFLQWAVIFVALSISLDGTADNTVVSILVFAGLPVLCSSLLLHPRTRRAGAGLLIGVAVGSIVGSGACVGLLLGG